MMKRRAIALLICLLLAIPSIPATASVAPSLNALMTQYDLYDPELDIRSVDFVWLERITTLDALRTFLMACRAACVRSVPMRLVSPLDADSVFAAAEGMEFLKLSAWTIEKGGSETHILLQCEYPAGVNILRAHETGDFSTLTDGEQKAYAVAKSFIDGRYPLHADDITKERAIYDYLREIAAYRVDAPNDPEGTPSDTAIDVLRRGRATCAGFADAFQLLGSMGGLEVGYVAGETLSGKHAWNIIRLDGQWYMVDVTPSSDGSSDEVLPYLMFNAGYDLMQQTHRWDDALLPGPLAPATDGHYAWGNAAFPELARVSDEEALLDWFGGRFEATGSSYSRVLCDRFDLPFETFAEKLSFLPRATNRTLTLGTISTIERGQGLYIGVEIDPG